MAKRLTLEDIEEAIESNQGWCTSCKAFTNYGVEPDAAQYECEDCGQRTVYGAEEALLMGAFS